MVRTSVHIFSKIDVSGGKFAPLLYNSNSNNHVEQMGIVLAALWSEQCQSVAEVWPSVLLPCGTP